MEIFAAIELYIAEHTGKNIANSDTTPAQLQRLSGTTERIGLEK